MANAWNSSLNGATLSQLQEMLATHHPGVQDYKQAFELTRHMPQEQQCQVVLCFTGGDRHHYQAPDPSVREIAVILPGDGDQATGPQDIVLYCKHGAPLQCISDVHSLLSSLSPMSSFFLQASLVGILRSYISQQRKVNKTRSAYMSAWLNIITTASSSTHYT